jgi:hypothetical protein
LAEKNDEELLLALFRRADAKAALLAIVDERDAEKKNHGKDHYDSLQADKR